VHLVILKRAVEPSTLFGFWFQGFIQIGVGIAIGIGIDCLTTERTKHGNRAMPFRVLGVFRGSNQKLRFAPNRCGADLNGSQCLQAFAQNPHAQLLLLG